MSDPIPIGKARKVRVRGRDADASDVGTGVPGLCAQDEADIRQAFKLLNRIGHLEPLPEPVQAAVTLARDIVETCVIGKRDGAVDWDDDPVHALCLPGEYNEAQTKAAARSFHGYTNRGRQERIIQWVDELSRLRPTTAEGRTIRAVLLLNFTKSILADGGPRAELGPEHLEGGDLYPSEDHRTLAERWVEAWSRDHGKWEAGHEFLRAFGLQLNGPLALKQAWSDANRKK